MTVAGIREIDNLAVTWAADRTEWSGRGFVLN